jgi:DNA-binding beta-propeller fold protein YncE
VGDGCPYGIAASATDSVAYTVTGNDRTVNTGKEGNMLEVVNFTTGKVTVSRKVGSDPVTVTLSPGGNNIYIADAKSPTIMVISTSTYTTTMIIHLPVAPSAHNSGSTHLK